MRAARPGLSRQACGSIGRGAAVPAEAQRQLERIGLGDRAAELAGNLPLGTQRILEIARALAADPVLLVLDEPAAGLRRKEKAALATLLRKLREEGVTILIVEHDMDFVMKLVDRLVVMSFGSKLVGRRARGRARGPEGAGRVSRRGAWKRPLPRLPWRWQENAHEPADARDQRPARRLRPGRGCARRVALAGARADRLRHRTQRRRQDNAAGRGDGAAAVARARCASKARTCTALDVEARVERGMCLVPEKRELFGEMSVLDNLLLGAYTQRLPRRAH